MKRIFLSLIAIIFMANIGFSQDITGSWYGVLEVSTVKLRMVINIVKTDKGYTSTLDSPDQGTKGMAASSTKFENSELTVELGNGAVKYTGKLSDDGTIIGTFSQAGANYPLNLTRDKPAELLRPQEPKPPFPYYSEDVKFTNPKGNITLAGTLTLPKKEGVFPVVVLISGSGAQNRNEEVFGHKPFLVLADHLTRNGIGVLRYDDRGVGESGGDFGAATSNDFANDVESAVSFLKGRKEVDKNKIGLIGHSEGGIIAQMVAANSSDVSYIVLLAGTGVSGDAILLRQKELIERGSGVPEAAIKRGQDIMKGAYQIIESSDDTAGVKEELTEYFKGKQLPEKDASAIAGQLSSPWMQFFIRYDPAPLLAKVKVPVLALIGEKDLQVPPDINLTAIKAALEKGGNKHVTVKELPKLNHLFQESETGLPSEYGKIEQTISPVVLDEITSWIKEQTK
ncbi:MAG: alpha/beta fold hydrolase [Acidobacteria bacterium]|nr:alpha/beta fold hydrolase [Acidobacteriota bacterium]